MRFREIMEDQYARHGDPGEPESYLSGDKFVGEWKDPWPAKLPGVPQELTRKLGAYEVAGSLQETPRVPRDFLSTPNQILFKKGDNGRWMVLISGNQPQLIYPNREGDYQSVDPRRAQPIMQSFQDHTTGSYWVAQYHPRRIARPGE